MLTMKSGAEVECTLGEHVLRVMWRNKALEYMRPREGSLKYLLSSHHQEPLLNKPRQAFPFCKSCFEAGQS